MKMSQIVLILGAMLGLLSCGFQQDPFDGRSEAIRNGQPPEFKPEPPSNIAADALRIDTEDFYTVKEGSTLKATIGGRVLLPNVKFKLSILNADEFPGATFNVKDGNFEWTVATGTVSDDNFDSRLLKVLLVTEPTTEFPTVMSSVKNVEIKVYRNFGQPEIVRVESTGFMREGETKRFGVVIKDPDATKASDIHLYMTTPQSESVALASRFVVETINQDLTDKTLWNIRVFADLRNFEVTPKSAQTRVEFQAQSRFAKWSPLMTSNFLVYSNLDVAQTTWVDELTVTADQTEKYSFTVYDPKKEGALSLIWVDDFARVIPGSSVTCTMVNRSTQACTVTLKPTASDVGYKSVRLNVDNLSQISQDVFGTKANLTFKIRVLAAPVTTTTTTSTTTTTVR